jgi:hypothetical protein
MVEESFYGKGLGCEFLFNECDPNSREYCSKNEDDSCDYYHNGVASCDTNSFYDNNCRYRRVIDR